MTLHQPPFPLLHNQYRTSELVSVIFRLKRTFNFHSNILSLIRRKFIQFNTNFAQVQAGYFFIQVFW